MYLHSVLYVLHMLLLVVGSGIALLHTSLVPTTVSFTLWILIAALLVVRYTTCRYRVTDVSLLVTGVGVTASWIASSCTGMC